MPNILINLAETQEHTYARYSYVLCSVMQCVNETHLHEVCQAVLIDRHVVCIKHIAVDQPYDTYNKENQHRVAPYTVTVLHRVAP